MTVTSRPLPNLTGADIFRIGSGLFFGAGGRGLSGGFKPTEERGLWGSVVAGALVIRFRGKGDRDSPPGFGDGDIFMGDSDRGSGGGRRGLLGRTGRTGSGLFGGSDGVDTRFRDLRVSFLRKSLISACLPVT